MARHIFTQEECRKGGLNQPLIAKQKGGRNQPREVKVEAGKKGFEVTCETHPFFARHWLKYCPGMKKANGTKPEKREA